MPLKPVKVVVVWVMEWSLIAERTLGLAGLFDCCGWNWYWPWPKCHACGCDSSVLCSLLLDHSHDPWALALCTNTFRSALPIRRGVFLKCLGYYLLLWF